jgi:hypothetical protein
MIRIRRPIVISVKQIVLILGIILDFYLLFEFYNELIAPTKEVVNVEGYQSLLILVVFINIIAILIIIILIIVKHWDKKIKI